jgi:hypothetical protein
MGKHNPEHEKQLNEAMKGVAAAEPGKMFGYPGYKVNGKLAVGLHELGVIAKVGADRAKAIIGSGKAKSYEPLKGRVWKDWVLLTDNIGKSKDIFEEAVKYVKKETGG